MVKQRIGWTRARNWLRTSSANMEECDLNQTEILNYLEQQSKLISKEIEKVIPRLPYLPYNAMWYALDSGGKKLRPVLCLVTCEGLGGNVKKAMPFAVAIELLHNFLLIHDDIEDGDTVRRNQPTVWVKYGIAHGINVGDCMFARIYTSILKSKELGVDSETIVKLVELMTETINHTGEGQALDIESRKRRDLTVEDYMTIVTKKTGYYLAAPIKGGAIIAHAPSEILNSIDRFGKYVGPVFQIRDDIIDLTEGKGRGEKGSDIKEGKRSFLVVYTASRCNTKEKEKLFEILDEPREKTTSKDVNWVTELFKRYKAIEFAEKEANKLLTTSKEAIKDFPEKLKNQLNTFAEFMLARKI